MPGAPADRTRSAFHRSAPAPAPSTAARRRATPGSRAPAPAARSRHPVATQPLVLLDHLHLESGVGSDVARTGLEPEQDARAQLLDRSGTRRAAALVLRNFGAGRDEAAVLAADQD